MTLFKNIFGNSENPDGTEKDVQWQPLTNIEQLDKIAKDSHQLPVLIFKHSTRCGISRMVLKQFEKEFGSDIEVTPYFLDLLAHRDVSNAIAEKFNVRHQSPQLVLIKDGHSVYNTSHSDINAGTLKSKL
jgi:bacillithiol system protein YtxJ